MSKPVLRLNLHQPFWAQMVTAILLCGLGSQLAMLTWRIDDMLFAPTQIQPVVHKAPATVIPPKVPLTRLFMAPEKADVPTAALSSLNLRLAAVIVSSQPADSLVIIEQGGQQASYGIQEVIRGTQARVQAIQADRVELLNDGRAEVLMLYDDSARHSPPTLSSARSQVITDPATLLDLVSVSPVSKAGALQGYRLNPGKDASLFQQSGLQPNDLAVVINGFDLRIPADAAKFMAQAGEISQLSITVIREDAEKNIFLDLTVKSME